MNSGRNLQMTLQKAELLTMRTARRAWPFLLTIALLLACAHDTWPADNQLTAGEKQAGWILLFDGQSLNGWMTSGGKPSRTPVQEGCINPHGCGDYMLVHTQQWSDCVLAFDFKLSKGCNSSHRFSYSRTFS
jgi:hypothetical protein